MPRPEQEATAPALQELSGAHSVEDYVQFGLLQNPKIQAARMRVEEAAAVASAREYDSLKDETMQEVKHLFAQATSQEQLLTLFRSDIIPKAEQALDQSIEAYQVGEIDFLQMIDNWREVLHFQVGEKRLESQLRQTLASLERVVGGFQVSSSTDSTETAPLPQ